MRACVVAGGSIGDIEAYKKVLGRYDFVICADSGLDHALELGITPDIVIGDMDSVRAVVPNDVKAVIHPAEKAQTDMRLAIDYALDSGYKDITLLCALGGRFDHAYANVAQLVYIHGRGGEGVIIDAQNEIRLLCSCELRLNGEKGHKLSLLPFGGDACGVTTFGLKYPLNDDVLQLGSDRGVSNEFVGGAAIVSVKSGMLLVIIG